jgi:hypothetical protein
MEVQVPDSAPAPAPIAAPTNGLRKISPISMPQKVPPTAPAAVRLTAWCSLTLPLSFLVAYNWNDGILE